MPVHGDVADPGAAGDLVQRLQDVYATIEHNVAAGDTSVNRYTLRATHTASGRSYEIQGLDMIRVRNGKLVEHWALADLAAMHRQLGLDDRS